MYMYIVYYIPEIVNWILAGSPLSVPLHVTVEATVAVIRNVDSSTSSPLTLVLFVSVAVAVIFPSILVLFLTSPIISIVEN